MALDLPNHDESSARLHDQCSTPLPLEARQAVALFNAGEYYKQHDLFELLWRAERGPVRDLYRAVLQVGVACYQVTRGNRRGALKMLIRGIRWLALLPDTCQGIDVARLRADALRLGQTIEALPGDADIRQLDHSLFPRVHLLEGEV